MTSDITAMTATTAHVLYHMPRDVVNVYEPLLGSSLQRPDHG
jgi:hypothetical protein